MRTRVAKGGLLAIGLAACLTATGSARAQSVPEGQSCGGLLCDMGVFGHKTAPAVAPPPAATVPQKVEAPVAAVSDAPTEPKKRAVQPRRVAKAAAKPKPMARKVAVAPPAVSAPAAAPTARPETTVAAPYARPPRQLPMFQPIYQ